MPQYAGGLLYFNRFTRDFDFDHCYVALDHLKRAERLAPFNPDIKQALLQVYLYYYKPIIQIGMQKRQTRDKALADLLLVQNTFPALNPEIIGRLHRLKREIAAIDAILKELLILFKNAGRVDPFNPFLKYREAVLLLEFGRREEALAALKQAVAIESDFLDALLMLQEEFKYFGVGTDFKRHVLRIERMGQSKHIRKGSYLFWLYHRRDFSLYRLRLPSALDSNV